MSSNSFFNLGSYFNDKSLSSFGEEVRFNLTFGGSPFTTEQESRLAGLTSTSPLDTQYREFSASRIAGLDNNEIEETVAKTFLTSQITQLDNTFASLDNERAVFAKLFGNEISLFGEEKDNEINRNLTRDMLNVMTGRDKGSLRYQALLPEYNYIRNQLDTRDVNRAVDVYKFMDDTFSTYSAIERIGSLSRAKTVLANTTYVIKPGIAPAGLLMYSAQFHFTVDIYQYQNQSMIDLATAKIIKEAEAFRQEKTNNPNTARKPFTFNIMVAFPDEVDKGNFYSQYGKEMDKDIDNKTIPILGPNIHMVRRMQTLKQIYGDNIEINVFLRGEGSHSKILASEDTVIIGTQNLTSPIGRSPYQSGSNYEYLRILSINSDPNLTPSQRNFLVGEVLKGSASNTLNPLSNVPATFRQQFDRDLTAEQKLFFQAKSVIENNLYYERKSEVRPQTTGFDNIGAPEDVERALNETLSYISKSNDRNIELSLILDQPFLLLTGRNQAIVERNNNKPKANSYLQHSQTLNSLLIQGRANVILDKRNYTEKVIDPIFSKLRSTGLLEVYNYDLRAFVDAVEANPNTKNLDPLDRAKALFNYINGAAGAGDFSQGDALQLLAIVSGNIRTASEPRMHVKAFSAYTTDNGGRRQILSNVGGSSNFSANSLGLNDFHTSGNKDELNLIFVSDKVRNFHQRQQHEFSLTKEETEQQLRIADQAHSNMVRHLTGNVSNSLNYNSQYEWQRRVDTNNLIRLHDQIKAVEEKVGFGVFKTEFEYDPVRATPISLSVSIDPNAIGVAGIIDQNRIRFKFTVLKTGGGARAGSLEATEPLVLSLDNSKVIGFSELVNMQGSELNTGFYRNGQQVILGARSRKTMTPIETTISLLSSVALETLHTVGVKDPQRKVKEILETGTTFHTIAGYMLSLAGKSHLSPEAILDPTKVSSEEILEIANKFRNRFTTESPGLTGRRNLTGIRQISGIDLSNEDRLNQIDSLYHILSELGRTQTRVDRELLFDILPAGAKQLKESQRQESITTQVRRIFRDQSGMFNDVVYELVNNQQNSYETTNLNKQVKETVTRMFTPYLLPAQIRTYGYMQGARRRAIYGYNEKRIHTVREINKSTQGLMGLLPFAFLSAPYEYNATSYLGKGGRPLFREVAGGGGPIAEEIEGQELWAQHGGYRGAYRTNNIGTETGIEIIEDAAVGFIFNRQVHNQYVDSIKHLAGYGLQFDAMEGMLRKHEASGEEFYIFNFDKITKAAQIGQRIKNVIGSRPLYDLTVEYQQLAEADTMDQLNKLRYSFRFHSPDLSKEFRSSNELQEAYAKDLEEGLKRFNTTNDINYKALLQKGYGIGALYGGRLGNYLSTELTEQLEYIKAEVAREFNFEVSVFEKGEERQRDVANELLRVQLLLIEMGGSGLRGFIGSSERFGPPMILMQLSGAYSDPYFANPKFGGNNGLRQAYIDRAVKKVKSSNFSTYIGKENLEAMFDSIVSWDSQENIAVRPGDKFRFDTEDGKTWMYRYDAEKNDYVKVQTVDQRAQFSIIRNIIDQIGNYGPQKAYVSATSAVPGLIGEDASEIIRELTILPADYERSEYRVEVIYDRTYLPGSNRRSEAVGGGLFKGVPIFVYGGFFTNIIEKLNKERGVYQDKLNIHNVQGVANISNFKSYFFSHASRLLTTKDEKQKTMANRLINESSTKELAIAYLLGVGDVHSKWSQNDDPVRIGKALYEAISSSEKGEMVALKANLTLLTLTRNSNLNDDFYRAVYKNLTGSINNLIGEEGNFLRSQFPALQIISTEDLLKALESDSGNLKSKLTHLLDDPDNYAVKAMGFLSLNQRGREMAVLAGGLDIMMQLINSKPITADIANVINDERTLRQFAAAANISYQELIENKELYQEALQTLATTMNVVRLYTSLSGSQSKVSLSSRMTANLEIQHTIPQSFTQNYDTFKKDGGIDTARKVMASILGAMTQSSAAVMYSATEGLPMVDVLSPFARSALFKAKFLGIYAGQMLNSDINRLKNEYETLYLIKLLSTQGFNNSSQYENIYNNFLAGKNFKKGSALFQLSEYLKNPKDNLNQINNRVTQLISRGFRETTTAFQTMYEEWALYEDKAMGIDSGEAMAQGVSKTGAPRMAFSIPMFAPSGDGKVRFYRDQKNYGVALSGQDVLMLGPQFGEFESELMKFSKHIWSGLTEGSPIDRIFSRVASSMSSAGDAEYVDVELTLEEFQQLEAFREDVVASSRLLRELFAGRNLQKVLGSKVPVKGGTVTAAASWLVPGEYAVIPEEVRRRYGENASSTRLNALDDLDNILSRVNDRLLTAETEFGEAKDKRKVKIEQLNEALGITRSESLIQPFHSMFEELNTRLKNVDSMAENKFNTRLEKMSTEIKTLRTEIVKIKQMHIQTFSLELKEIDNEIRKRSVELKEQQSRLSKVKAEISSLSNIFNRQKRANLERHRKIIQDNIATLESEIRRLQEQKRALLSTQHLRLIAANARGEINLSLLLKVEENLRNKEEERKIFKASRDNFIQAEKTAEITAIEAEKVQIQEHFNLLDTGLQSKIAARESFLADLNQEFNAKRSDYSSLKEQKELLVFQRAALKAGISKKGSILLDDVITMSAAYRSRLADTTSLEEVESIIADLRKQISIYENTDINKFSKGDYYIKLLALQESKMLLGQAVGRINFDGRVSPEEIKAKQLAEIPTVIEGLGPRGDDFRIVTPSNFTDKNLYSESNLLRGLSGAPVLASSSQSTKIVAFSTSDSIYRVEDEKGVNARRFDIATGTWQPFEEDNVTIYIRANNRKDRTKLFNLLTESNLSFGDRYLEFNYDPNKPPTRFSIVSRQFETDAFGNRIGKESLYEDYTVSFLPAKGDIALTLIDFERGEGENRDRYYRWEASSPIERIELPSLRLLDSSGQVARPTKVQASSQINQSTMNALANVDRMNEDTKAKQPASIPAVTEPPVNIPRSAPPPPQRPFVPARQVLPVVPPTVPPVSPPTPIRAASSQDRPLTMISPEALVGPLIKDAGKLGDVIKAVKFIKTPEDASAFIDKTITMIRQTQTQLASTNTYFHDLTPNKEIEKTITKLEDIKTNINSIMSGDSSQFVHGVGSLVGELYSKLQLSGFLGWRSPPLGSHALLSSEFNVFNLEELDWYRESILKILGDKIRFSPEAGEVNRNSTLSLFNPLTFMVSQLGDFDGDTISMILNANQQLSLERLNLEYTLELQKQQVGILETEIETKKTNFTLTNHPKITEELGNFFIRRAYLHRLGLEQQFITAYNSLSPLEKREYRNSFMASYESNLEIKSANETDSLKQSEYEKELKKWRGLSSEKQKRKEVRKLFKEVEYLDRYIEDPTEMSPEVKSLRKQKSKLEKSIAAKEERLAMIQSEMNKNINRQDIKNFHEAAAKWVANYTGVDYRFLIGKDKGGWVEQDVPLEILFTFVEQGRDLTGGIKDSFSKSIKLLQSNLLGIINDKATLQNADAFQTKLASLDPSNNNGLVSFLLDQQEMGEEVRTSILSIYNERFNEDQDGIAKSVGVYISSLLTGQTSLKNLQKYLVKGQGTELGPDEFEMMLSTLGKAGSIVLGKTFNTLGPLLYAQSPILALSSLVLEDSDVQDKISSSRMRVQIEGKDYTGSELTDKLMELAKNARADSEAMGGLLQTVQQFLRDSIKPKGSMQQFIAELGEKVNAYQNATDDKERASLLDEISNKFGSGTGLKALVNLNTLFSNLIMLHNETTTSAAEEEKTQLLRKMGIGETALEDYSKRLGVQGTHFQGENTRPLLAAYHVKQELVSVGAAFALEKALNDGEFQTQYKTQLAEAKSVYSSGNLVDAQLVAFDARLQTVSSLARLGANSSSSNDVSGFIRELDREANKITSGYTDSGQMTEIDRVKLEYIGFIKSLSSNDKELVDKDSGLLFDYARMSEEDKQAAAFIYLSKKEQVESFAGIKGEGLIALGRFDIERKQAFAGEDPRTATVEGWNIAKDGLLEALYEAMMGGKVKAEVVGEFFRAAVVIGQNRRGINQTPDSRLKGMTSEGFVKAIDPNTGETTSNAFLTVMRQLIASGDGNLSAEYLIQKLSNTAFGNKWSTYEDVIAASQLTDMTMSSRRDLVKVIKRLGVDEKEAEGLAKRVVESNIQYMINEDYDESQIIKYALSSASHAIAPPPKNNIPTQSASSIIRSNVPSQLASNADVAAEAFVFPVLALVGQMIAAGTIDENTMQSAAGTMISALAYNKTALKVGEIAQLKNGNGFAKNLQMAGVNIAMGTGFKARFAFEAEDPGKEFLSMFAREIATGAMTAVATGVAMNTMEKHVFGHAKTLDIDRFEGIRSVATSVISSMIGTVLGLTTGAYVRKGANFLLDTNGDTVSQSLKESLERKNKMLYAKSDESSYEIDIETEEGVVNYISESSFSADPETDSATNAALYVDNINEPIEESISSDGVGDSYSFDTSELM